MIEPWLPEQEATSKRWDKSLSILKMNDRTMITGAGRDEYEVR